MNIIVKGLINKAPILFLRKNPQSRQSCVEKEDKPLFWWRRRYGKDMNKRSKRAHSIWSMHHVNKPDNNLQVLSFIQWQWLSVCKWCSFYLLCLISTTDFRRMMMPCIHKAAVLPKSERITDDFLSTLCNVDEPKNNKHFSGITLLEN